MSTRLLRAAVSNPDIGLHRVTAVVSDDPALEDVLVGAYSRFVLVGADGVRLHEEVLYAGGWVRDGGRFRRLENLGVLDSLLTSALAGDRRSRTHVQAGSPTRGRGSATVCSPRSTGGRPTGGSRWSASSPAAARTRSIASPPNLDRFAATLRGEAARAEDRRDRAGQLIPTSPTTAERAQIRHDRTPGGSAWTGSPSNGTRAGADRSALRRPEDHRFPVAVVFVVPRREAVR